MNSQQQQLESLAGSVLCEAASVGTCVPEMKGTCLTKQHRNGRWTLSRIAHFSALEQRRREPGNCTRCGKLNTNGLSHCEACRRYYEDYRKRKKVEVQSTPSGVAKEIAQFRKELDRLRTLVLLLRGQWRKAYRKGYYAGYAGKRARFKRSAWIPKELNVEDKAQVSHAYDSE